MKPELQLKQRQPMADFGAETIVGAVVRHCEKRPDDRVADVINWSHVRLLKQNMHLCNL